MLGTRERTPAALIELAWLYERKQDLPAALKAYDDFLDLLICDTRDARAAEALRKNGLRVQCAQTIMRSSDDRAALARTVLSHTIRGLRTDEPDTDKSARAAADQP